MSRKKKTKKNHQSLELMVYEQDLSCEQPVDGTAMSVMECLEGRVSEKNEVLNIRDIMGGSIRTVKKLLDMGGRPDDAELNTHLRVMYEFVDFNDLIFELTPDIIRLLKMNEDNIAVGKDLLDKIEVGDHVALLNAEDMAPLTFNEVITGFVSIELIDLDTAIERATHWFVEDLLDSSLSFTLFTPYFLVAFRLALMEGEMSDEERFSLERMSDVWQKTLSSVMFFIGKKLQEVSIDIAKGGRCNMCYNLPKDYVEDYLDSIKK